MHPHVEEEDHRREIPSWMMMKTMAMAQSLGKEVQREVESPRCSDSDKRAPGEGLEAYALGIDSTVVIGCGEDAKIYEEISTNTDHR